MYQYIRHINSSKQSPIWLGSSFMVTQPKVDLNEGKTKTGI